MEKLVPSFETAKELSELGWNTETYFVWDIIDDIAVVTLYYDAVGVNLPAPTASEMLEHMVTDYYSDPDGDEAMMTICDIDEYGIAVSYEYCSIAKEDFSIDGINLADALAKMWMYNPKSRNT